MQGMLGSWMFSCRGVEKLVEMWAGCRKYSIPVLLAEGLSVPLGPVTKSLQASCTHSLFPKPLVTNGSKKEVSLK